MDPDDVDAHIVPASDITVDATVTATLERVVVRCVRAMSHCDMAGVSVMASGRVRPLAATEPAVSVIDELQSEIREGPCFDSLRREGVVVTDDLGCDPRWPTWGPIVSQQIGVNAVMSYCLFKADDALGVLNLYAMARDGFDRQDLADGYLVAAQAAVALTSPLARNDGQQVPEAAERSAPCRVGMKVRIARAMGGRWPRGT